MMLTPPGHGIPPERTNSDPVLPAEEFDRVVGALADGALCFPPPFDLPSALALAGNEHTGATAEAMFGATRRHTDRRFRIAVHEVSDTDPPVEREIVNLVTGATIAAAVLVEVATQLEDL